MAVCSGRVRDDWCITLGLLQDAMETWPLYLHHCGSNDGLAEQRMEEICAAIIREGGYELTAVRTARVLRNVPEDVRVEPMMSEGSL